MAAHIRRILVAQRDIDRRAGPAQFLDRRHQGCAFFDLLAQRRAQLRVKDRGGMFPFAVFADNRGLAIAFGFLGLNAERIYAHLAEGLTQLRADFHQLR